MAGLRLLAVSLLFATISGCSDGGRFAPVSGVVKLDGKPYGKAAVSFQPIGDKDNPNPGRGSSAFTDENGRFVLTSDDHNGAVVGKHLVRIGTRPNAVATDEEVGSPDSAVATRQGDPIPLEWNANSTKQFEVPPGGTDQANFDIVTKKK